MSATSLRQRGSLATLVACALVATACGGGSSSGAAAGTSSGAAVTSAAGAAAATAAGTTTSAAASAAGKTTAATTSAVPAPTTTKVVAKGGGTFCKDIAKVMNDASSTGTTGSVADTKALIDKGIAETQFLAAEAPSDIKADVGVLAGAVAKLYGEVKKANYDFTKVDPSALSAMDTPAVKAAETKVDAYVKVKCGIDTGADASS
jgi:hypothetical protein